MIAGDVIGSGAHDLSQLIGDRGRPGEQDRAKMFQTLQYIMENLIYHITEIMVRFSGWGPSSIVSQKSRYSSVDGDPHLPYHRNHGTVLCHVPNATIRHGKLLHRNHGTFFSMGTLIYHITEIMVRFSL